MGRRVYILSMQPPSQPVGWDGMVREDLTRSQESVEDPAGRDHIDSATVPRLGIPGRLYCKVVAAGYDVRWPVAAEAGPGSLHASFLQLDSLAHPPHLSLRLDCLPIWGTESVWPGSPMTASLDNAEVGHVLGKDGAQTRDRFAPTPENARPLPVSQPVPALMLALIWGPRGAKPLGLGRRPPMTREHASRGAASCKLQALPSSLPGLPLEGPKPTNKKTAATITTSPASPASPACPACPACPNRVVACVKGSRVVMWPYYRLIPGAACGHAEDCLR